METCRGGEGGLNSNFSEATNAVEHRTKSNKKHKKHRRKHSHCQEYFMSCFFLIKIPIACLVIAFV